MTCDLFINSLFNLHNYLKKKRQPKSTLVSILVETPYRNSYGQVYFRKKLIFHFYTLFYIQYMCGRVI